MSDRPQPPNRPPAAASQAPARLAPPGPAPALIGTPDQRLRVFVSSTLQELAPERAAARKAIAHLRFSPVLFEPGARPHPPRDLYRAYLAQNNLVLGNYWQRYGWVAPDLRISGLEDEYLLAGGKPQLIYVQTPAPERDPHATRRGALESGLGGGRCQDAGPGAHRGAALPPGRADS